MGNAAPTSPVTHIGDHITMIWDKTLTFGTGGAAAWGAKNIYTVPANKKLVAALIWLHSIDAAIDYLHFEASGTDITSDPGGTTPSWVTTTNTDERQAFMNPDAGYHLNLNIAAGGTLDMNGYCDGSRLVVLSAKLFLVDV